MPRENLNDLLAFLAVARERSFTRAAAQLGVSQSALSQTIRTLEARLGLRLLTRTTRSVAPTEAGERLLQTVGPHFDGIEAGLAALTALREKPAGSLRITSVEHAAETILARPGEAPAGLPGYQGRDHHRLWSDRHRGRALRCRRAPGRAGGEGHDRRAHRAGLPHGGLRRAVLLRDDGRGRHTPHDLTAHACISLRLPTSGGLYAWAFAKDGRELKVRAEGQLVFNSVTLILNMALAGLGLAYLPEDLVQVHLAEGRLIRVLADWCPPISGYHLYYPSRRQPTPAFALLVDALRFRARRGPERRYITAPICQGTNSLSPMPSSSDLDCSPPATRTTRSKIRSPTC